MCISSAVIIGVAGKYVAIAFPIVVVVLVAIQRFYLRTSRQLRFLDLETKGPLYSRFLECTSGLSTIQAFGWQEHYERNQWHYLEMSQRAYYMFHCLQRWLTVTIDFVVGLFAILLAVILIELRSSIGGGFIAVGLVNIMSFNGQLKGLITHWTSMEISMGAVSRIRGFAQNTVNEDENVLASTAPEQWPFMGSIRVQNLRVTYGKSHTPALNGVSFQINAGEKIAICGRTGSGKSTLMLCLLRMLDPEAGSSISIDGIYVQTLSRQSVRSAITYVSQEPTFIMDSVRINLDPLGTASDDALIQALEKAGLWDIVQAVGGLDMTPMPMLPLSPGQKQLFVLARALVHPKRIVLLDEPTAAVDEVTAARLKELMRVEFADSTVVNIAHRLESISEYDKVLILSKGSMVAFGKMNDVGHMLQNNFS
ncbi:putative multidrug resistance protein [Aureobasidium pullulans]|nr:putative multidrug resistance protein [Aureobasidium pullulans]